jgi:RHS repeat-associated protein
MKRVWFMNRLPKEESDQCFYRLSDTEIVSKGKLIRLIKVDGIPMAVEYGEDGLFPVTVDHLGSISAVIAPGGDSLLFSRLYNRWGVKKAVDFGPNERYSLEYLEEMERELAWSFAGLMHNPLIESKWDRERDEDEVSLYWSQTRVYAPSIKQWLSVDPLLIWKPGSLSKSGLDWNGMRYVNNDPVNYVDPSGNTSYLVSRDIKLSGVNIQASHNFILIVDDDTGKVQTFSFGKQESGKLGIVNRRKSVSAAGDTAKIDKDSLHSRTAKEYTKIHASDRRVRAVIKGLFNNLDYNPLGPNSNSAAQSVADISQGSIVKTPSSSPLGAVGAADSTEIAGQTKKE